MKTPPFIFFFGDHEVGEFSERVYPSQDGEVSYEPYRGPGHYDLSTKLRAGDVADCYFIKENERITFRVLSCPRYGVLSICGLSDKKLGA